MKANAAILRSIRRDDGAVTEVLGFILMFAMSSLILIISLRSFNAAQDNSNDLVAAVELRNVANRVSSRMVQASTIATEFPLAEFYVDVKIPAEIAGYRYTVQLRDRGTYDAAQDKQIILDINDPAANPIVYAETSGDNMYGEGATITGEASTFRVDEVLVNNKAIKLYADPVHSGTGSVRVHYWYDFTTAQGQLELTEGEA